LLDFNRTKLGLGINIVPANVDLASTGIRARRCGY